jgi:hypothetical protein
LVLVSAPGFCLHSYGGFICSKEEDGQEDEQEQEEVREKQSLWQ